MISQQESEFEVFRYFAEVEVLVSGRGSETTLSWI